MVVVLFVSCCDFYWLVVGIYLCRSLGRGFFLTFIILGCVLIGRLVLVWVKDSLFIEKGRGYGDFSEKKFFVLDWDFRIWRRFGNGVVFIRVNKMLGFGNEL